MSSVSIISNTLSCVPEPSLSFTFAFAEARDMMAVWRVRETSKSDAIWYCCCRYYVCIHLQQLYYFCPRPTPATDPPTLQAWSHRRSRGCFSSIASINSSRLSVLVGAHKYARHVRMYACVHVEMKARHNIMSFLVGSNMHPIAIIEAVAQ